MWTDERLGILVCPVCKGDLRILRPDDALACDACGLRFPIQDGIPILLPEEAEALGRADADAGAAD